ncbi:hypothetical protein RUM43_014907 [Polyplax serrata]|uniref:Uncharacterized protein n=1 Tax=Polyplax serrata TaxID=468196 RepID=A0AAN8NV31_POLSC
MVFPQIKEDDDGDGEDEDEDGSMIIFDSQFFTRSTSVVRVFYRYCMDVVFFLFQSGFRKVWLTGLRHSSRLVQGFLDGQIIANDMGLKNSS